MDFDEIQNGNIIIIRSAEKAYLAYVKDLSETELTVLPMAPADQEIANLKPDTHLIDDPNIISMADIRTPHKVYLFGVIARKEDFEDGQVQRVGFLGGQSVEERREVNRAAGAAQRKTPKMFRVPLSTLGKIPFPETTLTQLSVSKAFGNLPPPAFITGDTPQPRLPATFDAKAHGFADADTKPPARHEKRDDPFGGTFDLVEAEEDDDHVFAIDGFGKEEQTFDFDPNS
ncbi:MAG: hypothetical protein GW778_02000 [Alphaproteobacteria bacterium]|nr:hypothetical protein [Alphaproteobacteria bacterium]